MKLPIARRLALLMCLLPALAGAQAIVRHKIPGSDFPIALAVSIPPGATIHFISGQVPPVTDKAADPNSLAAFGDTKTQTVGVLKKIRDVLQGMGLGMGDVVKMQVFLVGDPAKGNKGDVAGFMEGYTQFFGGAQPNLPARAVFQVAALSNPGWLIEIEVVAAKK
ncbi:MAG: RidA family protein [Pseudomonadota bacterium]|nr:RidA family protein [Pseudomonadota bacterium]